MILRRSLSMLLGGTLLASTLGILPISLSNPSFAVSAEPDAYVLDVFSAPTALDTDDDGPHDVEPEPSEPTPHDEIVDQLTEVPQSEAPSYAEDAVEDESEGDESLTSVIAPASVYGDYIAVEEPTYDLLSAPLSTEKFNVAAVTWTGTAPQSVEIRTESFGVWGDWYSLEIEDSGSSGVPGTEPYIAAGSSGIQVRAMFSAQPQTFELVLLTGAGTRGTVEDSDAEVAHDAPDSDTEPAVNVSTNETLLDSLIVPAVYNGEPAPHTLGSSSSNLHATTIAPTTLRAPNIVLRRAWGAPEQASWRPEVADLKGAVIHHTAGNNNYSPAESPAIVRGIWNYHTNTRGWGDIGYNFLVDKYGVVYEGREGSQASAAGKMTIGAHAAPANTGTVGISVMGTYTTQNPEPIVLDRISDVIAWQFGGAGIDPTGTWQYLPSTGSLPQTMNRVIGHLEVGNTACPGLIQFSLPLISQMAKGKILKGPVQPPAPPTSDGPTPNPTPTPNPAPKPEKPTTTHGVINGGKEYATIRSSAIRVSPYPNAQPLRTVGSGEMVLTGTRSVRNNYGPWWQVTQGSHTGWILYRDLTLATKHSYNATGSTQMRWVRAFTYSFDIASTRSNRVTSFNAGDRLVPTGRVFGTLTEIQSGGRTSWVLTQRLSAQWVPSGELGSINPGREYSTVDRVPIKRYPYDESPALRMVDAGTMLLTGDHSARESGTGWWQVRLGNVEGWVKYSDIRASRLDSLYSTVSHEARYRVNESTAIYDTASLSSNRLASPAPGTTVISTGERYGWYIKVRYGSVNGWIPMRSVNLIP